MNAPDMDDVIEAAQADPVDYALTDFNDSAEGVDGGHDPVPSVYGSETDVWGTD